MCIDLCVDMCMDMYIDMCRYVAKNGIPDDVPTLPPAATPSVAAPSGTAMDNRSPASVGAPAHGSAVAARKATMPQQAHTSVRDSGGAHLTETKTRSSWWLLVLGLVLLVLQSIALFGPVAEPGYKTLVSFPVQVTVAVGYASLVYLGRPR